MNLDCFTQFQEGGLTLSVTEQKLWKMSCFNSDIFEKLLIATTANLNDWAHLSFVLTELKWQITSFLVYFMQDWSSQHFVEVGFICQYMDWLIEAIKTLLIEDHPSAEMQSFLSCIAFVGDVSCFPRSVACFCSGALADKKRAASRQKGMISPFFSWAPTSVIGFEKRDW